MCRLDIYAERQEISNAQGLKVANNASCEVFEQKMSVSTTALLLKF